MHTSIHTDQSALAVQDTQVGSESTYCTEHACDDGSLLVHTRAATNAYKLVGARVLGRPDQLMWVWSVFPSR